MSAVGWAVGLLLVWVAGIAWSRHRQARRPALSESRARLAGSLLLAGAGVVIGLYAYVIIT
jgi:hypothetical protein